MAAQGSRSSKCKTCNHPDHVRIDWLIASGADLAPLAEKYGLTKDSVWRHSKSHITSEYRNSVKVGPFRSEEELRKICAQSGSSVLERLEAVYSGLSARWLVNFEAAADDKLIGLSKQITDVLVHIGKLTREIAPQPANVSYHAHFGGEWFAAFSAALLDFARAHPEIRDDLAPVLRPILLAQGAGAAPLNITQGARDAAAA